MSEGCPDSKYKFTEMADAGSMKRCWMKFHPCRDSNPCPIHHPFVAICERIIRNLSLITMAALASAVERGEVVLKKTQVALFS